MSSEKDKEIQALQAKLRKYENPSAPSTSKNERGPPKEGPPNPPTATKQPNNIEILDFIQVTMATLESYKNALTN